jgi:hypothetical protein
MLADEAVSSESSLSELETPAVRGLGESLPLPCPFPWFPLRDLARSTGSVHETSGKSCSRMRVMAAR